MAFAAYSATAPVEHPSASRHRLRCRMAVLVQRLIDAMDEIDGDADLEPSGDDEPSLSFTGNINQHLAIYAEPTGGIEWLDLEDASEDEGAVTGDDEPEVHD